nr:MAG TPA: hypothetical protein [Caudoviricetes sp.]
MTKLQKMQPSGAKNRWGEVLWGQIKSFGG